MRYNIAVIYKLADSRLERGEYNNTTNGNLRSFLEKENLKSKITNK